MSRQIDFTKMVASGNDFIIIDNKKLRLPFNESRLLESVRKICNRKYGVGADGLLVIEKSKVADFKMRIFNPDGSEAEMCGNGIRCVALWANRPNTENYTENYARPKLKIETKAGILETVVNRDLIKIKMTEPKDIRLDIPLNIKGKNYKVNFINTGVPHTVLFVNNLEKIDVKGLGRIIRFHRKFLPNGTNVDFVKIEDRENILIRTYERGVEDETVACGTGAVASTIISNIKYQKSKIEKGCKINVHTQSGETLKVYFDKIEDKFKNIWLEGKAKIVFTGKIVIG